MVQVIFILWTYAHNLCLAQKRLTTRNTLEIYSDWANKYIILIIPLPYTNGIIIPLLYTYILYTLNIIFQNDFYKSHKSFKQNFLPQRLWMSNCFISQKYLLIQMLTRLYGWGQCKITFQYTQNSKYHFRYLCSSFFATSAQVRR